MHINNDATFNAKLIKERVEGIMKKKLMGALGVTLAATMMASMAVGAADITVTLGIWPEDTLTDQIEMHEGFVEKMKELRPDVTYEPAYYKYSTDTFMPMVEAGTVPTVFESWFTEPQKLIAQGAVADITEQLEERGWIDSMNPSIRELLSDADGHIYGVPRDGYALGLMCNRALFEEAGLVDENGVPTFPTTWDELLEDAKIINEKTGAAGLCLLAKDNAGGWHFSNIAWAYGATLVTENKDGTYTANLASDEAIAAMEYVKELVDAGVLTADPTSEDWGTGFTQLATGGAAMYIAANDAVEQPTLGNGMALEDLAMCALPAGPGGQYSLSGGTPYMFSKDATAEEIDAALDYIEVMGKAPIVTDEVIAGLEADAQMRKDAGIPVIKKFPCWINEDFLAAEEKSIEDNANVDPAMYQSYFDAVASEGLRTEEPGQTQDMYAELTKVLQAVITDPDADIPALMQTANDNYQAILDNPVVAEAE